MFWPFAPARGIFLWLNRNCMDTKVLGSNPQRPHFIGHKGTVPKANALKWNKQYDWDIGCSVFVYSSPLRLTSVTNKWLDWKCRWRRRSQFVCWSSSIMVYLSEINGVFLYSLKVPFIVLQLLRAQKKAAKKEQLEKVELERKHLSIVLQVQHLLQGLRQEHVKRDLLAGNNQAPQLSAEMLHNLNQLATLLGAERDPRLRWVPLQMSWWALQALVKWRLCILSTCTWVKPEESWKHWTLP